MIHDNLTDRTALVPLCLFLNFYFKKCRAEGEIAAFFCIGYGMVRFIAEFFRADTPPIYFGMSISQVISLAIAFAGLILLILVRRFRGTRAQNIRLTELVETVSNR
jgi:phosphatidylglycerol:prolipoprotein diacylglycerol transferase